MFRNSSGSLQCKMMFLFLSCRSANLFLYVEPYTWRKNQGRIIKLFTVALITSYIAVSWKTIFAPLSLCWNIIKNVQLIIRLKVLLHRPYATRSLFCYRSGALETTMQQTAHCCSTLDACNAFKTTVHHQLEL